MRNGHSLLNPGYVAAITPVGGGGGTTSLVTATTPGTSRRDFDGWVGFQITIGGASLTTSQLAFYNISGNTANTTVHIRDSTGAVLDSVTISASGQPTGFLYGNKTITLSAGQTYYVLMSVSSAGGSNSWYSNDTTVSVTADATVVGSCYSTTSTGVPTTNSFSSVAYGPVNFKY